MKQYSKVKRGMVFWFDPAVYGEKITYKSKRGELKSCVQNFNRPYLVISNDENNANSSTCNIVPITLEDKNPIPVHVNYIYAGKRQTVLVEQVRTVDIEALGSYIYTINDSVMKEVEKAIAIQFSVRPTLTQVDFQLESTMNHLEDIITNIIQTKVQEIKAQQNVIPVTQIEDTALRLGQMIEDLMDVPQTTKQNPIEPAPKTEETEIVVQEVEKEETNHSPLRKRKDYSGMSPIEKFNAKYNIVTQEEENVEPAPQPIEEEKPEVVKNPTKGKRNVWTTETRKQYLEDCERLSPQKVMEKYNLVNTKSVYQTKYLCKNTLKVSEE